MLHPNVTYTDTLEQREITPLPDFKNKYLFQSKNSIFMLIKHLVINNPEHSLQSIFKLSGKNFLFDNLKTKNLYESITPPYSMVKEVCISEREYNELKKDQKIVETLSSLDNSVVKSINRSLRQASQGQIRRVA